MANTVSSLSYANTFGDWMVATNNLVTENNILAKENYVKDSGTLFLSENSQTALQSNGNVIVQKTFSVQGIGSSAIIQNNLNVEGQGYFSNGNLSLATTGTANVGNVLNVLGSDTALRVANNSRFGGSISVVGGTFTETLQSNNSVNTSNASIFNTLYTNRIQSNTSVLTGTLSANNKVFTNDVQANTSILTATIQANTHVTTTSVGVSGTAWVNVLQANTSTNTANASVIHTLWANVVQANISTNTATASVTGTTFTDVLQANTSSNTSNASVMHTLYANVVQANSSTNTSNASVMHTLYANVVQANVSTNTTTASVTGTTFTDVLQANTFTTTATAFVSGTTHTNELQANTSANTTTLSVTGTSFTNVLQANTSSNTSNASVVWTMYANVVQANVSTNTTTASVTGTTFTDVLQANSSANTRTMSVTGTTFTDVLQANSSANTRTMSVTGTTFTNILQANSRVNTVNVWATDTVRANTIRANTDVWTPNVRISNLIDAESAEARVHNLQVGEGGLSIAGNFTLNGRTVFNSNEFIISQGTPNQTSKFSTFRTANGVANGVASNASIRWNETGNYFDINDVDSFESSSYYRIITEQQISDSISTTDGTKAASLTAAKTLNDNITAANTWLKSRSDSASLYANGAFRDANSVSIYANSAFGAANSASSYANSAFASANNVAPQIAPAFAQANAAFGKANAATAEIKGTRGSISPTSASLTLTSNNGIAIHSVTANTLAISTSQDLQTTASPSFTGLTVTGTPLSTSSGGTGSTSASSAFNTLIAAATGTESGTSGYVLATGGSGNFYWTAAGAGGAGTQPGTRITSNRLSYTGDGTTTIYATPTFSQANQVRVYINGVRQLESEYTLNSGTSRVTMTVAPVVNDKILVEVDGYAVYEYFANNIVYGPATGSLTAGTIQSAIDGLESGKMPKTGGTFTGQVIGQTIDKATANTSLATGSYVHNLANSNWTFSHSITGNAGTVTNGLYSTGSYANPAWLTSLNADKLSGGTISSTILGNSSHFIGTTSIALNRATGFQRLTGVNINGIADSANNLISTAGDLGYTVSGQDVSYVGHLGPQVQSQGAGAAAMSFHRPGLYAINFGLGTDNQLRTGGWSRGGASYVILDSGNYNSYAPTLTGTGASGNWNITSAFATNSTYANNITMGFNSNWNTDFSHAPAGSTVLRGDTSSGSSTGGPGGSWWFQQNMRHTNASSLWGVQVAWGWEDNANLLRTRNIQNGNYGGWVTYINSTNIGSQSVSYATSAGSATNAGYATSAGNSTTVAGLNVHANRNNEANKIVRTDANGYLQTGYINSSNGDENNASNPPRVWGTNGSDSYLRSYQTGSLSVGYAGSAGNATYAGSAGYAGNAGYASSAGNAGYATTAGSASNVTQGTAYFTYQEMAGMGSVGGVIYTSTGGPAGGWNSVQYLNIPSAGWWNITEPDMFYRGQRLNSSMWLGGTTYLWLVVEVLVDNVWRLIKLTTQNYDTVNYMPADGNVYVAARPFQTYGPYGYWHWSNEDTTWAALGSQKTPYYLAAGNNVRVTMRWVNDYFRAGTHFMTEANAASGRGYYMDSVLGWRNDGTTPSATNKHVYKIPDTVNYEWRAYANYQPAGYWYAGGHVRFMAYKVGT